MFQLRYSGWSWDSELQIIQADVKLEIDGELLIDEPLCVDVGLPAMLLSTRSDVEPYRWSAPDLWQRIPFFCCGCGDPECRAYTYRVRHLDGGLLELTELEEKEQGPSRELGTYTVQASQYEEQVVSIAKAYLTFIEGLDYRPLFADTVEVVKRLLAELEQKQ
ncbi:hypothetical protein [Paenibacillus sp. OAS669]|uniref:hypothetical protein n=1 Tax=Paenibacillus sp. OAS669 TaxID=2663821 RepID=UPI001788E7F0|nr:hypothetical protein [Paenibacillus sp. OAS669]MBE1444394.1 hypothetical protein [Paenibacillus sp. OAS669]